MYLNISYILSATSGKRKLQKTPMSRKKHIGTEDTPAGPRASAKRKLAFTSSKVTLYIIFKFYLLMELCVYRLTAVSFSASFL